MTSVSQSQKPEVARPHIRWSRQSAAGQEQIQKLSVGSDDRDAHMVLSTRGPGCEPRWDSEPRPYDRVLVRSPSGVHSQGPLSTKPCGRGSMIAAEMRCHYHLSIPSSVSPSCLRVYNNNNNILLLLFLYPWVYSSQVFKTKKLKSKLE